MQTKNTVTVAETIAKLRAASGGAWEDASWDGLISGSMDSAVTGVAVIWSPGITALKQAMADGCNLVLTKNPLYWMEPELPKGSPRPTMRVTEGSAGGSTPESI